MTDYQMVPIDSLKPSGYNPNQLSDDDQAQLLTEIRHQGRLLKPIVCRQVDDQLIIVDGEHSWHAAVEAGLAEVPVELIDMQADAAGTIHDHHADSFGEFEARRQTYVRNLAGSWHKVRLGRMFVDMLNTLVVASNRDLAAYLGITEGTVRNMILYSTAARLCAGRDDCPHEEAIARMGIRELRKLIAWLQGDADDDNNADQPTPAVDEPRILARLKRAWAEATGDERSAFIIWTGLAAETETALKDAFAAGVRQGHEQGTVQRVTVTQRKPGRPRKQSTNGAVSQSPEPVRDSHAIDERVRLHYAGKGTLALRILEFLATQSGESRNIDIINACNCNPGEVQRAFKKGLQPSGYVRKLGFGRWIITDYGRAALSSQSEPEPVTVTQPESEAPALRNDYTARGARIREARKARGLTMHQLSDLADVHHKQIGMAELGRLTASGGPAAGRPAFEKLEAFLGLSSH